MHFYSLEFKIKTIIFLIFVYHEILLFYNLYIIVSESNPVVPIHLLLFFMIFLMISVFFYAASFFTFTFVLQ